MTERVRFHFPVELVEDALRACTPSPVVWYHCKCGCEGHIGFARDDKALLVCSSISGDPVLRIIVLQTPADVEMFCANAKSSELHLMVRGLFAKGGTA